MATITSSQGIWKFPGLHSKYQGIASAVLFLVYSLNMIGNATIFFLFATDRSLHKPMYHIILNLSACDILFSTTTLPKIISKYWFQSGTISFTACFVQMYFVHYLGSVNSYILFLMALDRYLAIFHPLRYPLVLKNSTICIISITAWVIANAAPLMLVIRACVLPYCDSNFIVQCYCDHISITRLACGEDVKYVKSVALGLAMFSLLLPLSFILFSYFSIFLVVMRIPNMEGRYKTISTCTPQLLISCLYYLPRCFVYLSNAVGFTFSLDVRILLILLYSLLPCAVNPVIYCFKTKDMKDVLMKIFKKAKIGMKQVSK
ncbi:olfactory receptor 52K1-like [Thunnus albacares]|uniref:olfactory receptor 52K1-like n=1 Tax=Thunnus albacares TaxID=8236 RepID=UPI001CF6AE9A|nr:olfactory receptor 52K1-like [Thunnus albacares]